MEYKILTNDEKRMKIRFDLSGEKTCMKTWEFDVNRVNGGMVIDNADITFSGAGCKGHPKTICALIGGRELDTINTEALKATSCFQNVSCGMVLGLCIDQIKQFNEAVPNLGE